MNAAAWFIAQAALAAAAVFVAPGIARQRKAIRVAVCGAAFGVMLLWPLMRVFPVQVIDLLGAPMVACTELTGLAVPAALFFGVAARHLPRASDRRAVWALQRKLRGTGLSPRYVALDREGLIAAEKPCLVQLRWGFFTSHMVPVLAADEDGVTIGDPAHGRRTAPWEIFLREWKGQAIVVERAG